VPCSTSRVVLGAHRAVGLGTHRGSGPREVHTTISSLKPIYSTRFPLITYTCGRLLHGAFRESLVLPRYYKWDIVKTRQASHGLTETRQKSHWKIMLYQGGGRKIHTLWDRWTCANGRVIPRHKGSSHYRIAHGWKDEFGSFNLQPLKFLIHFREPGSSLYFIFISYILIFSFLIFILTFLLLLSFFLFFICSPWTLKLHCTYLLPHA
jgi:hypothetical protein